MSERRAADLKKAGVQAGHELTKEERHIQMWKVKKLIKSLTQARGNGTSMISLILPPNTQISLTTKMLNDEMGTATNIKSRVNRLSVLGAITSTLQILKHYNRTPPNGLIVYSGMVTTDEGKEKRVRIDFEPFKPVNTSLYLCDNKFHTEALGELLQDDDQFGFIVMDGNGCLFGTVTGSSRNVLHKFTVDLPKKHGRGGQSALRFARLRLEKRHNYVRKVAETAVQLYVPDGAVPAVRGVVLAGSADFKDELFKSDLFDGRLKKIVIKMVDVSYGGENGFAQAIEQSQDALANVKFVQEKRLVSRYFDEIAQDTGKYCFGVRDTFTGLEMGAIKTLILYENLDTLRVTLKNNQTGEERIEHFTPAQMNDDANFIEKESGIELETIDNVELVEWLAENFKQFGCELQFITDRSQEGSQFCKGFGGIGGILRWPVDFGQMNEFIEQDGKAWDEDSSSSDGGGNSSDEYDPDADFGF